MHDTLQHLFRYKAWANDELLTALARLGAWRRLTLTRLAIKALSHSYVVDRIFAAHLQRQAHPYTSANLSELPTLDDLAADIRTSDQEYIKYVCGLDRDALAERLDFVFTDGAPGRMSREEMLIHVINHGTGHRGQVSALMLLNAVSPAKDGFTTWLHEAQASTRGRG
ncbi:MAG TPA: DinB family protein [Paraburkholderia sp.]|uniref:DinB family protein n=1 Tax=Paraburkholderia sp. TaxID=1926495 RepID=UPI002B49D244|nr:DinB family protein [Paraburkholderia sp.]HKR44197.1 DinB family protein [Paraburkholderia sp.]